MWENGVIFCIPSSHIRETNKVTYVQTSNAERKRDELRNTCSYTDSDPGGSGGRTAILDLTGMLVVTFRG